MPVIIYIVGVGHSGSTLLDLLLGSHSKAFSVGELVALSTTGRKMRQQRVLGRPCDCGAPTKLECPIWSEVDRQLQQACGTSLGTIEVESADPEQFRTVNRAIYDAIAEASGQPYIIESSKRTSRFERLVEAGFDVRPIHILREPHGVVASHLRKGRDWRAPCWSYARHAVRTRRLLAGRDFLRIRYEALATRPEETIRNTMAWLGLDFEPEQLRFRSAVHHQLAGNRMRHSGDDSIRLDERWKTELTAHQQRMISFYTLPARMLFHDSGRPGGAR